MTTCKLHPTCKSKQASKKSRNKREGNEVYNRTHACSREQKERQDRTNKTHNRTKGRRNKRTRRSNKTRTYPFMYNTISLPYARLKTTYPHHQPINFALEKNQTVHVIEVYPYPQNSLRPGGTRMSQYRRTSLVQIRSQIHPLSPPLPGSSFFIIEHSVTSQNERRPLSCQELMTRIISFACS